MKPGFLRDVDRLLEDAVTNQCSESVEGCEAMSLDAEDWCGVCMLVHDVREIVKKHASLSSGPSKETK